jgi:hypothetical protein
MNTSYLIGLKKSESTAYIKIVETWYLGRRKGGDLLYFRGVTAVDLNGKRKEQLLWPWTRSYSEFLPHIPVMGRSHVTHFQDCDSMVWMWPPKFMFWKRNWVPRVTVSRGGTFGRWLGHVRSALGSGSMLVLWKQLCYLQSRFAIKASLVPSLCLVLLPCGAAIRGRCHKNSSR